MFPEWTVVAVFLVFIFATFEQMSTWFSFLCFEPQRISLEICFAIPYYFSVMFQFVWTITFLTFCFICITCKCGMAPFPTVLTLRNIKIHICFSNCYNIMIYVKTSVNKTLIIWGQETKMISLKIWVLLITLSMISEVIRILVSSTK